MNMGMSYEQFWEDDPTIAKAYFEAFKMKQKNEFKNKEWELWKQGVYVYEALVDVSPILHAFSKATKPLPFPEKPLGIEYLENDGMKTEEQKKQEEENERLKAQVFFNNWARATAKQFKKRQEEGE